MAVLGPAPSSGDALLSAVHILMRHRLAAHSEGFSRRAIESLVKRLREKREELEELVTAVTSAGRQPGRCVTIQRTLDGRLQVAGRKGFPHVIYARLWRWPDLHKNELKPVTFCRFAFDLKHDSVCVNPYHYDRVASPAAGAPAQVEEEFVQDCLQPPHPDPYGQPRPPGMYPSMPLSRPGSSSMTAAPVGCGRVCSGLLPIASPQNHTGHASSPQNHMGHASSPQNHMGHASSPQNHMGHASSPQNHIGHASSPQNHMGHASSPQNHTGHASSPQNHMGHASSPQNHTGHASSPQNHMGHASSPQNHMGHASSLQNHMDHASSPQNHMGHASSPQNHMGHASSPQNHIGHASSPQNHMGHVSSPQNHMGHVSSPQNHMGHASSPQNHIGHASSPQNHMGHASSPQNHIGHASSPQNHMGHVSSPQNHMGHVSSPQNHIGHVFSPQNHTPTSPHQSDYSSPPNTATSPGNSPAPYSPAGPGGRSHQQPPLHHHHHAHNTHFWSQHQSTNPDPQSSHPGPAIWCSVRYFERAQQVGDAFRVPSGCPVVTVDGCLDPAGGERFCLGRLSSLQRPASIQRARLLIGRGLQLECRGDGDIWMRCLSDHPVFVQSQYLDQDPGDQIHKVHPGAYIKVFDLRQCHRQMQQAAVVGVIPELNSEEEVDPSVSVSPGVAVDDLRRLCVVRLSFVTGWGRGYPPCWLEVHLHRALQLLDQVLHAGVRLQVGGV